MLPLHIAIGDIVLPFYEGLYFAISIGFGLFLGAKAVKGRGLCDEDGYWTVVSVAILGAVVGGRLSHILFWSGDYYLANPLKVFAIWEGGISITGGIAGGALAAFLACRRRGLPFVGMFAGLSPVLALSQGLGRIGCFLNGDAFGLPTSLPWGVELRRYGIDVFGSGTAARYSSAAWRWCLEAGLVAPGSDRTVPLHPTQLYEAAFDLGLAIVLVLLARRKAKDSTVCWSYALGYCLFRFLVEYIRGDGAGALALGTTSIQFLLAAIALVAACALVAGGLGSRKAKAGK